PHRPTEPSRRERTRALGADRERERGAPQERIEAKIGAKPPLARDRRLRDPADDELSPHAERAREREREPRAVTKPRDREEEERPHEVEMLFDRERPEVLGEAVAAG